MRPPQAVIFDMDGVIVNSEPLHARAFYDVVRDIGYTDKLALRFDDYVGRSDQDMWTDFIAIHQPPQSFDELLVRKRERVIELIQSEQPLFAGVPALVEQVAASYALALASGSERQVVEEVLKLNNLRRLFSVVVTSSEVEHGKPAPDIFLRAAELLRVPPASCCVIEDSKPGITAALAAGMQVIAITNTYPAAELNRATQVVGTYEQIQRLLLPLTRPSGSLP
jgi:HAD superfamily hydrolase (TIGR01549 family)